MDNKPIELNLRATFKDPGFVTDTKSFLRYLQLHTAVVPGGCTKWLQAPDVSWNAPYKAKLRELYDDWMVHGAREETSGGNPKPPPHEVYLQWIVDTCKSTPRKALAASCKICGITTALEGNSLHQTGRAHSVQALVLDDEVAMLLDVSDSEGGEDSDSDASIESGSSSEDVTSQTRAQHATTSRGGAGCTYAPDCQCELCDDDF